MHDHKRTLLKFVKQKNIQFISIIRMYLLTSIEDILLENLGIFSKKIIILLKIANF